jgi:hypothetical protein
MSLHVMSNELYQALRSVNVEEDLAIRAAVLETRQLDLLATKTDLKLAVAELRTEIASSARQQNVVIISAMVALTGIYAAIVRLF